MGLDAQSAYPFPVVAFAGKADPYLLQFMHSHPGVARVIALDHACPDQRLSWLRRELDQCRQLSGTYVVVIGLEHDEEVNELRWYANATVFQLGSEPPSGVRQVLPQLHPSQPDSFLGCLNACVDPLASFGPAVMA